jgi:hypothetical protein
LTTHWAFNGNTRDSIGNKDLTAQPNVTLVADRFGTANSAVYCNNSYLTVPPGIYFSGDFTICGWVKVIQIVAWTRLLDFGIGTPQDNVYLILSMWNLMQPVVTVFNNKNYSSEYSSGYTLNVGQWFHIAAVLQGTQVSLYVNGISINNRTSYSPRNVIRTNCFVGCDMNGSAQANAYFDDIKIFNRSLSQSEIIVDMNQVSLF